MQQQQPNSLSSENGANSDEGMGDEEPVQDSVLQDESSNNETNDDGNGSENAAAGGGGGGGDGAFVPASVVRDYEVYYYDPKNASRNSSNDSTNPGDGNGKNGEKLDVFKDLRTSIDDPFEVKFMRAEGIYAHGYHSHACQIAVALAKDLLESPLKYNLFSGAGGNGSGGANHPESGTIAQSGSATGTTNRKKKPRVNAASHKVTQDASKTLSHCAFLCTVNPYILIWRIKKFIFSNFDFSVRSSAKFRNIVAWPSKLECLVLKWPGHQPLQNPWRSNWPIRNLNL